MGMPVTDPRWTADMVRALPDDGNRYEVIDGELFVTPAPSRPHQRAVGELLVHLRTFLRLGRQYEALASPADIEFSKTRMVQPDILVAPRGRKPGTWKNIKGLVLAVEVLSPSTARADRQVKRRLYQQQGVSEYRIVDLDARVIERWRPGDQRPEVLGERLPWQPDPSQPAFELGQPAYFAEKLDD